MPTLLTEAEGNTAGRAIASCRRTPRGRRTQACTETPCARTGRSHARPSGRSPGGPLREGQGRTPEMHERGKSDRPVVPAKLPNNTGSPGAEAVEGRGLAEGNTDQLDTPRTQGRRRRAKRAGSCAGSSTEGQGCAVHGAVAPCHAGPSVCGLPGDTPPGRTGGGRGDVGVPTG